MGFLDKVKSGAEQVAAKTKEEAKELQTKRELGQAYDEFGKAAYELVARGEISHAELEAGAERIRSLRARLEELAGGGAGKGSAAPRAGARPPGPGWFTRHHPFGRIPLLEDGDVRVGESNTILRYLSHKEGRRDLYPESPAQRAKEDWALDTWSTQVRPALSPLESAVVFNRDVEKGDGDLPSADPDEVTAGVAKAQGPLDAFERFVADNGTVLGEFTIADCACGPVLWRGLRLPLDFAPWPQ